MDSYYYRLACSCSGAELSESHAEFKSLVIMIVYYNYYHYGCYHYDCYHNNIYLYSKSYSFIIAQKAATRPSGSQRKGFGRSCVRQSSN
jgi:hypothetical protein